MSAGSETAIEVLLDAEGVALVGVEQVQVELVGSHLQGLTVAALHCTTVLLHQGVMQLLLDG